jgi:alkaline phosphatase D
MMKKIFSFLSIALLAVSLSYASKLQSGPMIGYNTMSETLIWVQTKESAEVVVEYWNVEDEKTILSTDPIITEKANAYIAKCLADQVRHGTKYGYRVLIDGEIDNPHYREGYKKSGEIPLHFETPKNWRFRETGHAIFDFSVGFGSCAYINQGDYGRLNSKPYGGEYQIFESIYEVSPDAFIWLGDNTYLREPDWTSRTGIHQRWTHDRSIPHMRGMLATMANYATWDDHDYGPNNAGWEFWNKAETTRAFTLFHGNPSAGLPEIPGIFTFFNLGDANFYIVDNRTHRTPDTVQTDTMGEPRSHLGKAQVDWLVETMRYQQGQSRKLRGSYPANFNIVCIGNQVLSKRSRDSYASYPEEYEYLMSRLMHEGINGVIFLSGDVHFSEVTKVVRTGGGSKEIGKTGIAGEAYTFIELTSSPLTSGSWPGADKEENPNRLDIFPGEMDRVGQRNFATISFSGPLEDRAMTIRYYDSDGNLLNQQPGAEDGETTPESIIFAKDLIAPQNR